MGFKINLHITQKCNFNCKYCFAHFDDKNDLTVEAWKHIIDNIAKSGMINAINFAGGEPVLYPGFHEILDYAHSKGFRLSIISNGSLMLNPELMPLDDFAKLDTIGISIDSINPKTLTALGACTKSGRVFTYDNLKQLVSTARTINPAIRVKINTVVTNVNHDEDLTSIGAELSIDRWKFLRMKLFSNERYNNEYLLVSDQSFNNFISKNSSIAPDVVPESDLTRSYIMVDNQGRLLDDEGTDYSVVGNLLYEDFDLVFKRYHFDFDTYNSRYAIA